MPGQEPAKKVRRTQADERGLIAAAQRDPVRFTELYELYFELVYAYVARRVKQREATEDITSEVFHSALKSLPRYRWTGAPFAAWLFRIAANLIADKAKKELRTGVVSGIENEQVLDAETADDLQTEIERNERQSMLFRLVKELPDDQRRVIELRFAQERSIGDIARELGRSEGAIKQLQFRAIRNLRQMIEVQTGNE
jgi:RNA polymerase sigma-70 factor (ECF subfamily)